MFSLYRKEIPFNQLTMFWFDPDSLKVRQEWKLNIK